MVVVVVVVRVVEVEAVVVVEGVVEEIGTFCNSAELLVVGPSKQDINN